MDDLTLSTGPLRQWNDCRVRRLRENLRGLWWAHQDLNLEPTDYESAALTVELWAREADSSISRAKVTEQGLGIAEP